jgi:hypothetical protein
MDRKSGGGSRKKKVTGSASGGGVFRRGEGVSPKGTGKPVGNASGYNDRKEQRSTAGKQTSTGSYSSSSYQRSTGTPRMQLPKSKILTVIIVVIILYLLLRSCSGMFSEESVPIQPQEASTGTDTTQLITGDPANNDISPFTGITGPRTRRTEIIGGGNDVFTIMIYMCGTDLESNYGMATADLNEMLHADISKNLNIIVETGGTARWRNSIIKNTTNQRYQVTSSGLRLLEDNIGKRPMTDPATLKDFIMFCAENYPANRYALIFWDHGGGSLSGYGHDQLFPRNGSMTINQIHTAFDEAGIDFDFIGFDACLMATLETAYMLNYHADYMIASEETEPGIGWYYTDWITALSADTSMDTVGIGKMIIDDFIDRCSQEVPRETTTLSLIDLVTLNNVVDETFREFAMSADSQLDNNYKIISNARSDSREFNRSMLDQVDLIDLAENIGSTEAKKLVDTLKLAVSYNRTSRNIARANGVSIYFPYDEIKNMSPAMSIYENIGMSSEYTSLIRKFASMVVGGQITSSGSSNPLGALLGTSEGSSSGSSVDLWSLAWNVFFANADFSSFTGSQPGEEVSWLDERQIKESADYYQNHYLDASSMVLTRKGNNTVLQLTDEQWDLIQNIELNIFFDDGSGFIDLGLDNVYEFDDDGDLIIDFDGTWVALDNHVAAYYLECFEEVGDFWSITGRIPALLNGTLVDIMVHFNNDYPYGVVTGARINYGDLTDTVAKGLIEIQQGDVIDFLCDYYTYDEEYQNSYYLGEQIVVAGDLAVSNVHIGDARCMVTYRLTDIYNNAYWTPAVVY